MSELRLKRVNNEMVRIVSELLAKNIKDPRVQEAMISVTDARVTPDFKYAKVFVSILDENKADAAMEGLKSATGFIRREVGARLRLRITPELSFVRDTSIATAMDMSRLIDSVMKSDEEKSKEYEL